MYYIIRNEVGYHKMVSSHDLQAYKNWTIVEKSNDIEFLLAYVKELNKEQTQNDYI